MWRPFCRRVRFLLTSPDGLEATFHPMLGSKHPCTVLGLTRTHRPRQPGTPLPLPATLGGFPSSLRARPAGPHPHPPEKHRKLEAPKVVGSQGHRVASGCPSEPRGSISGLRGGAGAGHGLLAWKGTWVPSGTGLLRPAREPLCALPPSLLHHRRGRPPP